ncbi:MAG TPA: MBL fold metallo-hydrolase [Nevskiaceae bacterium]|nr:MBL fold metallo-hydrolase [Nevskiaceae bacterium]
MDLDLRSYDHGIYSLDSGYLRPRLDAIHLIVEKGRVAIVDTGTFRSVPRVEAALAQIGLSFLSVDYVILTHVHLDHAGGAGELMRRCPEAQLVVHPRGAPHMVDPSKLWAGTVGVYGEERARADYGELVPVAQERIIEAPDESSIRLATRELRFLDTPGHAKHHFCLHDPASASVFTGDTFGLSYRELDQRNKAFIFPTTTPVHFAPPVLHASVNRIAGLSPRSIYLTHYTRIGDVGRLTADLHRLIDAHAALADLLDTTRSAHAQLETLVAGVRGIVIDEANRQGGDPMYWQDIFVNDIDLNAAGIAAWIEATRRKASA